LDNFANKRGKEILEHLEISDSLRTDSEDAVQTIPHCHIHLIPRRKGEVVNSRGVIRNVIPGKANYP